MILGVARLSRPAVMAGSIVLILSGLAHSTALAQETFGSRALPDAPQPAQVTTPSEGNASQQTSTGSLSGTVLDANGNVLQGARVTLADPSGAVRQAVQSGNDGQFAFTGLPANIYTLTVSAPGMSTLTSTQAALHAG